MHEVFHSSEPWLSLPKTLVLGWHPTTDLKRVANYIETAFAEDEASTSRCNLNDQSSAERNG